MTVIFFCLELYSKIKKQVFDFLDRSGSRITGMMWIIFTFIIILRSGTAMVAMDI